MKHLVLVGLPGAGKTTVGRAAAALAGLPFLDMDEEIERRTGLTPPRFFQERGEAAFRAAEVALSRELAARHTELAARHTIVVAPGGGWITQPDAREALKDSATLLYLKVTPKVALERLGEAVRTRPLLATGDPASALAALLQAREHLYRNADYTLDTEGVDLQQLTEAVAELARYCAGSGG
jgi:shikimate kinase